MYDGFEASYQVSYTVQASIIEIGSGRIWKKFKAAFMKGTQQKLTILQLYEDAPTAEPFTAHEEKQFLFSMSRGKLFTSITVPRQYGYIGGNIPVVVNIDNKSHKVVHKIIVRLISHYKIHASVQCEFRELEIANITMELSNPIMADQKLKGLEMELAIPQTCAPTFNRTLCSLSYSVSRIY